MNNLGAIAGRRLGAIAVNLSTARMQAAQAAAMAIKTGLVAEARRATGDGRMSHVGRGVRLSARYDIETQGQVIRATIRAVPPGPWRMLSHGTRPHGIAPRRRGGKRAVVTPDGVFARVQHPGARGRHTADRGFVRGRRVADQMVRHMFSEAVKRGFRGAV